MRRCKVLFIVHYKQCIIECNTLGALSNAMGSCKVLVVVHYKHGIIECNILGARAMPWVVVLLVAVLLTLVAWRA